VIAGAQRVEHYEMAAYGGKKGASGQGDGRQALIGR